MTDSDRQREYFMNPKGKMQHHIAAVVNMMELVLVNMEGVLFASTANEIIINLPTIY